jgi:hypothetical protein
MRLAINSVDLLHSFDGPVTIQRVEEDDVGKGRRGVYLLEAHGSSKCRFLKEIWQKTEEMTINI